MSESPTEQILEIIRQLAEDNDTFTSDDIRPLLPPDLTVRQIPAAVGKARRDGLVVEVTRVKSRVPERKGSLVPVLRGAHKPIPPTVSEPESVEALEAAPSVEISEEIAALRMYLESRGYLIGAEELTALLLMLSSRGWLVLAGPTGTGKSSLVQLLADALAGRMYDIQVKPNWTSSDDVLGYYSELSGQFLPGRLYEALTAAAQSPSVPLFVRFDEMNLASPEYYLAELLSAGESWSLDQHSGEPRSAVVNLPPTPAGAEPASVALGNNVFLIGTLNMDETSKILSPKVLDRAAVYDLHHVDLYSLPVPHPGPQVALPVMNRVLSMISKRPRSLADVRSDLDDASVLAVADLLSELEPNLRTLSAPIGYRQRDAFLTTVAIWRRYGLSDLLSYDAVIDVTLRSAVLPKLQGSSTTATNALRGLAVSLLDLSDLPPDAPTSQLRASVLSGRYPRTLDRVLDMLEQAEQLGYFSAW